MKYLFIMCTVALLSACASGPATQYYHLSDSAYRLSPTQKPTAVVRVVLAEPLKSGSLLYQNDAQTLHFAKKHLWAEPLDIATGKQLANALNANQSRWYFVPANLSHTNMPELVVYLDRFQGRFDGQTQITGYSTWRHQGKTTLNHGFDVLTAQQGDGYTAMNTSLSLGLQQVATLIAP